MRSAAATVSLLFLANTSWAQGPYRPQTLSQTAGPRPTLFVQNRGQAPADAAWQAVGAGFEATFSHDGFVLKLLKAAPQGGFEQRISFVGANPHATIEPLDPQPGKISFFHGQDSAHWAAGLKSYARLRYAGLYPGIDLLFYSGGASLEYDFVVSPGADPSAIRLRAEDGRPVRITPQGALQVGEGAEAVLHRPLFYQNLEHGKQAIEGRFTALPGSVLGFQFGHYDRTRPLVIDPALNLLYSTYLGGPHDDEATAIALDAQNNLYLLGFSASQDYPVSGNAYQQVRKQLGQLVTNIVVTKLSPSGALLYSTFVGGSTDDTSSGLTVDARGNAYFTGVTRSADFPVTANAYQTHLQGASSAFLAELGPDGSTLQYSSFFGSAGGSTGGAVALNPQGNVVLGGSAGAGLPTSGTAYLKTITAGSAAFVAVFNFALSGPPQLLASTYYGAATPAANNSQVGNLTFAMAVDSSGNPWITGQAFTNNLPTSANALKASLPPLDPNCDGGGQALNSAAYVAKLSADLTTLVYASYLSSGLNTSGNACSEYAHAIALDSQGNVFVAGSTASSTFPTTAGAYEPVYAAAGYSEFVSKLAANGASLAWSTYLGANGGSSFQDALALDTGGNVWITGTTPGGSNFPLVNAYQSIEHGGYDGHLTQFKSDGSAVLYSTYLGGSGDDVASSLALDSLNNVYVGGYTTSRDFPTSGNAFQPVFANGDQVYDGNDVFVTILGTGALGTVTPATAGGTGDTTVTVSGAGLLPGATCSLVQGANVIAATGVSVAADGSSISCVFGLTGAAAGSYDVEVTNPGATALVSKNAFTVVSGGQPQVWSNIAGRSVIRTGVPSTFDVTYGNSGTVDAYFTQLWISFPSQLTYQVLATIYPTLGNASDLNPPSLTDAAGRTYLGLLLPWLPAGSSFSLPIQFTDTNADAGLQLETYVRPPWFDSRSDAIGALQAAQTNPGGLVTSCLPSPTKAYLTNCLGDMALDVSTSILQILSPNLASPPVPVPPQYASAVNSAIVELAAQLQGYLAGNLSPAVARPAARTPVPHGFGAIIGGLNAFSGSKVSSKAAQNTAGVSNQLNGHDCIRSVTEIGQQTMGCQMYVQLRFNYCNGTSDTRWVLKEEDPKPADDDSGGTCSTGGSPGPRSARNSSRIFHGNASAGGDSCSADNNRPGGDGGGSCSSSAGSIDPNDKSGPAGDGTTSRYVKVKPLTYSIGFENQPAATLPAAQVVVSDQLDPAKVDLTTVTLGSIAFGANLIPVPPGLSDFNTIFAVSSSLSVRIQGSLNAATGLLKWTFTSIDPSTGLPPSDPTVGFLPPDTDGVKGQASVAFSVMPKNTLTTGTQLPNLATVVFDANAPISTPAWLNTIDVTPPVSAVATLGASQNTGCFPVSWSGTDGGSGIATYTVFVSDNGGTFTQWQTNVTAGSVTYSGLPGHTYGFYSIATDGAGNREVKTAPDAGTAIGAGAVSCSQTTPAITWSKPAAIQVGTTLGAGQLNATANVAGTFVYNPAAGTVLPLGNGQTLSVTFTPADTFDYTTATASVSIDVTATSPCDISQDGATNVVDVQRMINEALGVTAATDDLNHDGAVNVVDVQLVINAALGLGCHTA